VTKLLGLTVLAIACTGADEAPPAPDTGASDTGQVLPVVDGVTLEGAVAELPLDGTVQLRLMASLDDGSTEDRTADATWTSSADPTASVVGGLVTAREEGTVTITAVWKGFEEAVSIEVRCRYPKAVPLVAFGETFPEIRWQNAVFPGPTGPTTGPFDLEDVACGRDGYDAYDSVMLHISATWCGPCQAARSFFLGDPSPFADHRVLALFSEVQDDDSNVTVTSLDAHESLRTELGDSFGIRLGDFDATPTNALFTSFVDGEISAFPTHVVIRRSDMKVVAWSVGQTSAFYTAFPTIVANLDWDWTDLQNPVVR